MKNNNLIRELKFQPKKTKVLFIFSIIRMIKIKSPTIVLFSKNHELNELDKLKLESKTSDFLKDN